MSRKDDGCRTGAAGCDLRGPGTPGWPHGPIRSRFEAHRWRGARTALRGFDERLAELAAPVITAMRSRRYRMPDDSAAQSTQDQLTPRSAASDPVTYRLDAAYCIADVNAAFERFAIENGAPGLTRTAIVGAPVWNFVAGIETRAIYESIFARVRTHRKPVQVPFRCDAPELRRFMELRIELAPDGDYHVTARLVGAEPQPAVALLDPDTPRSRAIVVMCSWCKRVRTNGEWLEADAAVVALGLFDVPRLPMLSHGVCEPCAVAATVT